MAPRVGLRLYLALAFASFAVAASIAFGVVAGRIVSATIEQRIGTLLVRGASEALATIDRELRERQDDLNNFASMLHHAGTMGTADLEWIGVDALVREEPRTFGCDWAAGADLQGNVVAASPAAPQVGTGLGREPWFAAARERAIVVSALEPAKNGKPVLNVIITRPMVDRDNRPFAVIVCKLGQEWSDALIQRVEAGLPGARSSSDVVVLDATSQPVMVSSRLPDGPLPERLLRPGGIGNEQWMQMPWGGARLFMVAEADGPEGGPAAQLGWRAIVRRDAAEALQPATAVRTEVYVFSGAIALIAALLGLFAADRIVSPLRGIAEAARRIGAGELGVHIPALSSYREVVTLADSLRNMLAALRGNEARLAALNENLDQRVRQRTSEIAEAHEALTRQESRLRAVIETATDGLMIVGEGSRIENFNPACEAIFGWKAEEIVGHHIGELIVGDSRSRRGGPHGFDDLVESLLESGESRGHVRTVRGRRRGGEGFPLEVSLSRTIIQKVPTYVAIVRDVTEAVRAHDELFALATKDGLTGLRNRRYFLEGAETEFARARRHGRGFSLMLIDADHFKQVNDTYGHDAGDRVLQSIADVALESLRGLDLVGRLGGEEFAAAMPEAELATALAIAERLRQQIAERSTATDGGPIAITVSIGVAAISAGDATLNQMLRRADQALYAAKNRGRNQVSVAES
jgi:diguanylate cyclase (GGDEF)-like protein/PAS domain S-box-containing protein